MYGNVIPMTTKSRKKASTGFQTPMATPRAVPATTTMAKPTASRAEADREVLDHAAVEGEVDHLVDARPPVSGGGGCRAGRRRTATTARRRSGRQETGAPGAAQELPDPLPERGRRRRQGLGSGRRGGDGRHAKASGRQRKKYCSSRLRITRSTSRTMITMKSAHASVPGIENRSKFRRSWKPSPAVPPNTSTSAAAAEADGDGVAGGGEEVGRDAREQHVAHAPGGRDVVGPGHVEEVAGHGPDPLDDVHDDEGYHDDHDRQDAAPLVDTEEHDPDEHEHQARCRQARRARNRGRRRPSSGSGPSAPRPPPRSGRRWRRRSGTSSSCSGRWATARCRR